MFTLPYTLVIKYKNIKEEDRATYNDPSEAGRQYSLRLNDQNIEDMWIEDAHRAIVLKRDPKSLGLPVFARV